MRDGSYTSKQVSGVSFQLAMGPRIALLGTHDPSQAGILRHLLAQVHPFKRVFSREAVTDSSCGRQPAVSSPTPFIAAKRRQIIEGVSPLVAHKCKVIR